jgi:hypothetical protein
MRVFAVLVFFGFCGLLACAYMYEDEVAACSIDDEVVGIPIRVYWSGLSGPKFSFRLSRAFLFVVSGRFRISSNE